MFFIISILPLDICKKRSVEGGRDITIEELAMHRVLSEHVFNSFASNSTRKIQNDMVRSALEVTPVYRKK
jgi:hypothetical protein